MRNYNTAGRRLLMDFLSSNPDRQFTVDQITAAVRKKGSVSKSAVYRNIGKLAEEGLVCRMPAFDGKKAAYRYAADSECLEHLHLKCVKCGKITHLEDAATQSIVRAALNKNGFSVNEKDSVLYGICRSCKK